MKKFFKYNGLSVVLLIIFIACFAGQIFTGFHEYNSQQQEEGAAAIEFGSYLQSGHFIETTFENWESEFLQMGMYVVLTAFLFQKGSSESNDPDYPDEVVVSPLQPKEPTPWPVRKGGWILKLYKYSLSIALFILFVLSFMLHWYGSMKDFNHQQYLKGKPLESAVTYLGNTRLWFESFQNSQSEFLAVLTVVILSIYLRHEGSSQSKELTDPNSKTS